MPSAIHGRGADLNCAATAASVDRGSGKSGSVDGSGTFIAAISARSQSIG